MQMEQVGEYPHVNYIDRRSDPDTESHTDVNNTKKLSVSSVRLRAKLLASLTQMLAGVITGCQTSGYFLNAEDN